MNARNGRKMQLRQIDLVTAENLARGCEYALLAVQPKGNPINWGDAGQFYAEGYNQALADINAAWACGIFLAGKTKGRSVCVRPKV